MAILRNIKADNDELERLRAENAALRAKNERSIRYKIGEKGGLSVYGLGRFPVTLYREQWESLLERKEDILAFIALNVGRLKLRGE